MKKALAVALLLLAFGGVAFLLPAITIIIIITTTFTIPPNRLPLLLVSRECPRRQARG